MNEKRNVASLGVWVRFIIGVVIGQSNRGQARCR
jgi:hypothetical protein